MSLIKSPNPELLIGQFCIKPGNSPYNKAAVTMSVETARIVDSYKYRGNDLVVLRPVIDKLIVDYKFAECGKTKNKVYKRVVKNALKLAKQKIYKLEPITIQNVGYRRFVAISKLYAHNYILHDSASGAKILLHLGVGKNDAATPYLKFELNPARLQAKGMQNLRTFIDEMLSNNFYKLTFENLAKTPKSIKTIHIAVDMLGVDASDIEGKYLYKDKKLKKHSYHGHTGRLESNYFLMPENDKNQAYWYNKLVQMKEEESDPIESGFSPRYGKSLYTRFEYRINETDKPIANLKSLTNHLVKFSLRAVDYNKIKDLDYTHLLFIRYALNRTKAKALELIPEHLTEKFSKIYDKAILNLWQPEKIWENGWLLELEYLGLYQNSKKKK